ncbi:NADH-quinone oxidoreductase subunit N, partial [bacterium]|nr:NADH-quinone oxidoreductase subunit N [bacterium]
MTFADLWFLMPFFILGAGSLAVLLCGAFFPGRYLTGVATAAALGAAVWALQTPPLT